MSNEYFFAAELSSLSDILENISFFFTKVILEIMSNLRIDDNLSRPRYILISKSIHDLVWFPVGRKRIS